MSDHPWGRPLPLSALARGPLRLRLAPDAATRAALARDLGLESLPELVAELNVRPWLDGAELKGRIEARVEQLCSVTLEAFEQPLAANFEVRVLPASSPNAVDDQAEGGGELTLDPDAPDPPDLLEGEDIDLTAYVVEHLALEIDPFPRKPGAQFDYVPPTEEVSPFAVLKQLKDKKD
ncbi:MAG: YceD family protein [Phenylobacterium sp.]|uniref:YceD family protein n=1 Tax=Phenylobacterium sp. TaxID=1871053 RepID=UPI003918C1B7